MSSTATPIPLVDEDSLATGDGPGAPLDGSPTVPSLAMREFGLLAKPRVGPDADRRVEDWIASQIDLAISAEPGPEPRSVWDQLVERLPAARPAARRPAIASGPETAFAEWSRFRVAYRRGITAVRLLGPALVKERHVRELTRDLIELIEAGNHRIILNFHGIERAGSWVALAVDEVARRAKAADGGELKVCGLSESLADVLDLAGMAPGVERHRDEDAALSATWPSATTPRALPVEILLALASASGSQPPPIRGGAPTAGPIASRDPEARTRPAATSWSRGEPGLWLIVRMGASRGRPVPVAGPRFLIGRRRDCQLRLGSPMVSKLHAAIERRDGRILLADLGSTNGTILNGRPLRGREAEIHDGDRIQVGPVVCTVATAAHRQGTGQLEAQVAGWLHEDDAPGPEPANALDTAVIATSATSPGDADAEVPIRTEIIQDVLVITPETGELEHEVTIERLRAHLHSLLAEAVPRRVVINIEYVAHLTGHAIGVLLAHHLRLDRSGGALRICQARARIMAALHQVRLTMLIECHPTLDEAVLSAWPEARS